MRNLRRKSIHNESSPSSYLCIILLRSWWLILRHTPSSIIHCHTYHFFYYHLLLGILELYPKWIIKWFTNILWKKKRFSKLFRESIRLLCLAWNFVTIFLFIDFNLAERCHWKAAPTFFLFCPNPNNIFLQFTTNIEYFKSL